LCVLGARGLAARFAASHFDGVELGVLGLKRFESVLMDVRDRAMEAGVDDG
jgi:hypothetical protein